MNDREARHVLKSVVLVAAVYALARATGWIGPGAHKPIIPEIFWPLVLLVAAWGVWRLLSRGTGGDHGK